MKKILGLDLGTSSIGWAIVNEGENDNEQSSIIKLGVRVNPLTVDEQINFEKGKSITTTADRTLKRSARRNLQRYKLRREALKKILFEKNFISEKTLLSEQGNRSTFETYRLRAKAATEAVTLDEFARILLMINKKRGYKSSRKAKSKEEGSLIDAMDIAKQLYETDWTPGEFVLHLLQSGKKYIPDFYRSDLQAELDKVWNIQNPFHSEILTDDFKKQLENQGKVNTVKIFLGRYKIYTAENKGADKRLQAYQWRVDALHRELSKEELAFVISEINGSLNQSSGYLGAIGDRSKELYFNKQTVGQYLMAQLEANPNTSLTNQVFYRQDYLDEFNILWTTQCKFHPELIDELKKDIRDVVIFYQRRLKSQKGLVNFCEFEQRQIEVIVDGKKKTKIVGYKVCPKSSPIFQEFKIWQILNNVELTDQKTDAERPLEQEEKELLFQELTIRDKLTKDAVLKLLFNKSKDFDLNFKEIEGNRTIAALYRAYAQIVDMSGHGEIDINKTPVKEVQEKIKTVFEALGYNTDILEFDSSLNAEAFEKQPLFRLWHLLYSFEGDNSNSGIENLLQKIKKDFGFEKEFAQILTAVTFQPDYGSLSAKAIRKILPYLTEGNEYSLACEYAGYRHSKASLTKEELDHKQLKDKLTPLPKNSLRNPVVEKILNQMINVVNLAIQTYGKPDEIRIELARELKKSAKEREDMTKSMNEATSAHEKYRKILKEEFGLEHVSRNDIIRYKLYKELESRGFKTLYTQTYIPQEKLFSKEFDIEHIIPQSRLFDDSFSNKTLENRAANIEKGNETAFDYVASKFGDDGIDAYQKRLEDLLKEGSISRGKYNKLLMKGSEIPDGFIARELRDSQYIAKAARQLLEELVRDVIPTTGSITNQLREDWQLIDVMQELNWDKYEKLGLTETFKNRDGKEVRRITDWTKRNDHRHHAMDALTIAFTKRSYIQYLNNLNARSDKSSSIYGIQEKELYRDKNNRLRFKPPMPLNEFRASAKEQLENTLVSIKAKNKVATSNVNVTQKKGGTNKKNQLTPRGQLHLETVFGKIQKPLNKEENVNASFTKDKIAMVGNPKYRIALLARLAAFDNDPKKAFTGKNSLQKNPLWLDEKQMEQVPEKVKTTGFETIYTIRKEVGPSLSVDKVVDAHIKAILVERLLQFDNDPKKAFVNLDENPIWLNKEKGIAIKRVTITGISNATALHNKKDKDGHLVVDEQGNKIPVDFVTTGNNHHVAIYRDEKGILQENVVSFFEATERVNKGFPIVDKDYKKDEGWTFLFTMKDNEYFIFPNEASGFDPKSIDLTDPVNYALISPNLFRVQSKSSKDYWFRHHLETSVQNNENLKEIAYKRCRSLSFALTIVKVRVNHIGQIVSVGEY